MRILRMLTLGAMLALAGSAVYAAPMPQPDRRDRDDRASSAFQAGYQKGQDDARAGRRANSKPVGRYNSRHDRDDWAAGYYRGYNEGGRAGYRPWDPRRPDDRRRDDDGRRTDDRRGPYGPSGPAAPPQPSQPDWLRIAQQIGYNDGLRDGANDHRTGHSYRPTQMDNYKNADRGYSSAYGSKQQYKDTYRVGYERGYRQGWDSYGR